MQAAVDKSPGKSRTIASGRSHWLRYWILLCIFALGHAAEASDLETLLSTKVCAGCQLSGVDLTGKDLSEAILAGADLSGARLIGANLTNCLPVKQIRIAFLMLVAIAAIKMLTSGSSVLF